MNLPNALTLSRLLAVPVLMALLIVSFPYHDQLAAGVFFVASLTDTLDGNLARRRGQVTELGKFLDPLADKLFILSVLIVLVQEGELAAWVVVVIFGRELLITVLRSLGASQGQVIAATPWGKTKTVLQVLAVILLILQRPYPSLEVPAEVVVGIAVAFTVLSGVDYLWRFRHVVWRPEGLAATGAAPGSGSPVNPLVRRLHEALSTRGLTLAVAESCTGGLLAAAITDQPGSSAYFKGGIVAYSNEIKERLLGVPAELLARHGAVSAEVARAMAEGVRRRLGTDLALSITGIAGPEADGTEKPVGLTHIWVDSDHGGEGRRFVFDGDRWQNRHRAVVEALTLALARVGITS
ncbi:MAG TPA: CDP-diacylglycerol--glycerol-3-phosphate 3-phosphatidyltransferase [Candidatus Dormibacteraeota bacterium]|jgi:nicotinamide-nucleotide amidase|nr:CDP-diacylglycerol--glycerol-3-phosphate 3-phosphatidyltransferase [Candidatus Dormibacteraeota bacterium]